MFRKKGRVKICFLSESNFLNILANLWNAVIVLICASVVMFAIIGWAIRTYNTAVAVQKITNSNLINNLNKLENSIIQIQVMLFLCHMI